MLNLILPLREALKTVYEINIYDKAFIIEAPNHFLEIMTNIKINLSSFSSFLTEKWINEHFKLNKIQIHLKQAHKTITL